MTTPKTEAVCRADCTSGCHPDDCDHHGSFWPGLDASEAVAAYRAALIAAVEGLVTWIPRPPYLTDRPMIDRGRVLDLIRKEATR